MSKISVKGKGGFTLVEMAIVLVIIGLILGAVLKGKDVINSAKQKQFYAKFLKGWQTEIVSYYDRTGYMLGDGKMNGGTHTSPNGWFDNVKGSTFSDSGSIDDALKRVGLTPPTSNTAQSGQFTYSGAYSGTRTITVNLWEMYSDTDKHNYNAIYLTNVPTDLAIALDKMVDGQLDAHSGKFRRYPDNIAHPNLPGGWPAADTSLSNSIAVVNAYLIIDLP